MMEQAIEGSYAAVLLRVFQEERDALLERSVEMLQADDAVTAAWLFGSLGRGNGDSLSDLDLWVGIKDNHVPQLGQARRRFAGRVGEPLLWVEAPQNAPAGGAYLMAVYPGAVAGPYQVDWYWQPESAALRPADTRLLFDRITGPGTTPVEPHGALSAGTAEDPAAPCGAEEARNRVSLFWAMLLISARYVTRQRNDEPLFVHAMLRDLLREAAAGAGAAVPGIAAPDLPSPERANEKLAVLRALAGAMEELMPMFASAGAEVPAGVIQPARRYLDAVQVIAACADAPEPGLGSP